MNRRAFLRTLFAGTAALIAPAFVAKASSSQPLVYKSISQNTFWDCSLVSDEELKAKLRALGISEEFCFDSTKP